MQTNIVLLGVVFLGGFVGFILGLTLQLPKTLNLKVAVSLIAAALGGAPLLFMRGLGFEKWMYPIGLVMGLLWTRIISARFSSASRSRQTQLFAWLDMVAIAVITLVVIVCAAFTK
jgi:hypothetical protein